MDYLGGIAQAHPKSARARIPPPKMQQVERIEGTEREAVPEAPWPSVQPSARRAPKMKRKPPMKAELDPHVEVIGVEPLSVEETKPTRGVSAGEFANRRRI